MVSAKEAVHIINKNGHLFPILRDDFFSDGEVGAIIGLDGELYDKSTGSLQKVTLTVPNGNVKTIDLHTHPTIDAPKPSPKDIQTGLENKTSDCLVILSQEMFTTNWDGHAVSINDGKVSDAVNFKVICSGSSDGPIDERHLDKIEEITFH